jgi:hypothetical protein
MELHASPLHSQPLSVTYLKDRGMNQSEEQNTKVPSKISTIRIFFFTGVILLPLSIIMDMEGFPHSGFYYLLATAFGTFGIFEPRYRFAASVISTLAVLAGAFCA